MNQTEGIAERVACIVAQKYDGVYSRLAKAITVDAATIKAILEGKSKPSWKVLDGILQVHPEISSEWLMRGEGDPARDVNADIEKLKAKYSTLREKVLKFQELFRNTKFDL